VRRRSLLDIVGQSEAALRIFAYGSLMWDPAFSTLAAGRACLHHYGRSFCVWTALSRGTPELPGLGLGLRRAAGSKCFGSVIEIEITRHTPLLEALWDREMWTGIYRPEWVTVSLESGLHRAVAFVVEEEHPQFAGELPLVEAARHIALAQGKFGPCLEYFRETLVKLKQWGDTRDEFAELEMLVQEAAQVGNRG
jgi:cation transport protein ChaC